MCQAVKIKLYYTYQDERGHTLQISMSVMKDPTFVLTVQHVLIHRDLTRVPAHPVTETTCVKQVCINVKICVVK